jgi:hypothetical protein
MPRVVERAATAGVRFMATSRGSRTSPTGALRRKRAARAIARAPIADRPSARGGSAAHFVRWRGEVDHVGRPGRSRSAVSSAQAGQQWLPQRAPYSYGVGHAPQHGVAPPGRAVPASLSTGSPTESLRLGLEPAHCRSRPSAGAPTAAPLTAAMDDERERRSRLLLLDETNVLPLLDRRRSLTSRTNRSSRAAKRAGPRDRSFARPQHSATVGLVSTPAELFHRAGYRRRDSQRTCPISVNGVIRRPPGAASCREGRRATPALCVRPPALGFVLTALVAIRRFRQAA